MGTTTSPCSCRTARHVEASRLSSRLRPIGGLLMPVSAVLPRLCPQPKQPLLRDSVGKRFGSPKLRRLLLAVPLLPAPLRLCLLLCCLRIPLPLKLASLLPTVLSPPPCPRTALRPPNSCVPCHPPRRRLHSPPSPVLRPLPAWRTKLIYRTRSVSQLLLACRV